MSASNATPITATCHCGAISITVPCLPEYLNACQCSICRKYSSAWAYYKGSEVQIRVKHDSELGETQIMATTSLAEKLERTDQEDERSQQQQQQQQQQPSPLSSASLGNATRIYVWGDRDLEFHACCQCGCITHWWHTDKDMSRDAELGVNGRLFDTDVLKGLEIREDPGP